MKKRLFAFCMSLIMVLSLLLGVPATSKRVEAATAGSFTVTGGTDGVDYSYENNLLMIKKSTQLTISTASKNYYDSIYIEKDVDANLVLAGVDTNYYAYSVQKPFIEIADGSTGDVSVKVQGYNRVRGFGASGIQKNGTAGSLTIDDVDTDDNDDDELCITCPSNEDGCAVIGGAANESSGNIIVNGSKLFLIGMTGGALIGGGSYGSGSDITINGGNLILLGINNGSGSMQQGALIGGGLCADASDITINGGTIKGEYIQAGDNTYNTAEYEYTKSTGEPKGSAAIGGGRGGGNANNIVINGGTMDFQLASGNGSAVIGAGDEGVSATVAIHGGNIKVSARDTLSAGIGVGNIGATTSGAEDQTRKAEVTITGGTIDASGGAYAPSIGAAYKAHSYTYISGGSVKVAVGKNQSDSIGIGNYQNNKSYKYVRNLVQTASEKDTTTNKETITLKTYQGSANQDLSGKLAFTYSDGTSYAYGTKDVKADEEGYVYAYLPDGVSISTKSGDGPLNILYNQAELKQWYNDSVTISAEGYKVCDSQNGTYQSSYVFTSSDSNKTLYFKGDISGEVVTRTITVSIDKKAPGAMLYVGNKSYYTVNTSTGVQAYSSNNNQVTIQPIDEGDSGIATTQYAFANAVYAQNAIESNIKEWKTYTSALTLPETATAVYVKITDKAGNVGYVSSPIYFNDSTAPTNKVTATNVAVNSAVISLEVSDDSTVNYAYVALKANETAPTDWNSLVGKITTSNGGQGTCESGSKTISKTISGLSPNTSYIVYVISKNVFTDGSTTTENVSTIATASFTTPKMTADVSDAEYSIKSEVSTTSYTYDLKKMLEASGLSPSDMTNLSYTCTASSGSILSTTGNLAVSNGVVTIPVYSNLSDGLSQKITVVFKSSNYEDITAILTVKTVGKKQARLSGVTVSNMTYNGVRYTYSGTPSWYDGNSVCADESDTVITYTGINGTSYETSELAPIHAGTYQVTFAISDDNTEYKGEESIPFTIVKASLTSAMSNVYWCLDGTTRIYDTSNVTLIEDGKEHQVTVEGYPEDKVIPQYSGTHKTSLAGDHKATVTFALTDEAANDYVVPDSKSLNWTIVDRITPDMSSAKWVYKQGTSTSNYVEGETTIVANQKEYQVEVTGLPEGVTATYSGTCKATKVGTYKAVVTFGVTDSTKYKNPTPSSMQLTWKIEKNTASASPQEFSIRATDTTASYTYDVNSLLQASGLDKTMFENLTYSCAKGTGNILSATPTITTAGVMTIPVKTNLAEDISQDITVYFTSDNYNTFSCTLTVKTAKKTTVYLSGVTVPDMTYTGEPYQYMGTISWLDGSVSCVDSKGTDVTYVGIEGTSYATSTTAPTDAGTYQVCFAVKSNNSEYKGSWTDEFTIKKASLADEMENVFWYMDDTKKLTSLEDSTITEDGSVHKVTVKGYPSDKVTPQYSGTSQSSMPGEYTTTVEFALTNEAAKNYNAPQSMTWNWKIVDRITPDMSSVKWIYKQGTTQNSYVEGTTTLLANREEYQVEVTGLPEGVSATYSGTYKATDVGTYTAKVSFTVEDSTKYKNPTPTSMELSWAIAKNTAYVSGQTYTIPASNGNSTYTYDLNDLLIAAGMSEDVFDNLAYSCAKGNGNIVSGTPTVDANGIMTIPVASYLGEDVSQDITVSFTSDNYNTISTTLTLKTTKKTSLTLSNVWVSEVVYDGKEHPYSGTIQWMNSGVVCAGASDTNVTYVGVNGTQYEESTTAPTNAGTYQVNFAIKDSNANYRGAQSYTFTIRKAELTSEMSNVFWYIDGTKKIYSTSDATVTENGSLCTVEVKGYPSDKVEAQYSGTYSASACGEYTATVEFVLSDEAAVNYNAPQAMTLNWKIVDRITPDMSGVRWLYKQGTTEASYIQGETQLLVNGNSYHVEVTGLPEGVEAQYSGTCEATKVGEYVAKVTFSVTDSTKYKAPVPDSMELNWTIEKNTAHVSGQLYSVKASVEATSYEFDVNDLLETPDMNADMFENLTYACEKENGNVLSDDPTINAKGIMTIPVAGYLAEGISQNIKITFESDNYHTFEVVLTVKSTTKTVVTLSGVSVNNMTYTGNPYQYAGTISWLSNGVQCVTASDTEITYVGVNGTSYNSPSAPTSVGNYQVTFKVKDSNANYKGSQTYFFAITKADISSMMTNVSWYIDGTKKIVSAEDASVVENGNTHSVQVKGYPSDYVTPQYSGTYSASVAGEYIATVDFVLSEEAASNYYAPQSLTLSWKIVDRITPNMSNVEWVYSQGDKVKSYVEGETMLRSTGTAYVMFVSGLPEGVTATYSGVCEASMPGEYTAKVTFTVTDPIKYKAPNPSSMELTWNVYKNVAFVSGQTYPIKAQQNVTTYHYNANNLLTASGMRVDQFEDISYTCEAGEGSILSSAPSVNGEGVLNIPVNTNLSENLNQIIYVTFTSSNYEDIKVPLTIKTISGSVTQVELQGVTVENKIYNGNPQGYTGDILWKDSNGTVFVEKDGTKVSYIGVNGTTYNSAKAPTNVGMYQVTFEVKDTSQYEGHVTYQYEIKKADLSAEMQNIIWCLDGKPVTNDNPQALLDGRVHTVSIQNYPDAYVTPIYFHHQKVVKGTHTTIVEFEVNELYADNFVAPEPLEFVWSIVEELDESNKITPDMSKVKWICKQNGVNLGEYTEDTVLYINGKKYTVEVIGLPEGVNVSYQGVCAADTEGTFEAIADFSVEDTNYYNMPKPSNMRLQWKIVKTEEKEENVTPLPTVGTDATHGTNKYVITSATAGGGTVQYVSTIGKKASLKKVDIPATIVIDGKSYTVTSIAKNAFSGCKKLTKVKMPNTITTIGANAFKNCTKLTKITIPNSVESIGSGAFSGCKTLKSVTIKSSAKLTKIGDKAFYKCSVLTKITLPKNVTIIGNSAFYGDKKLKTITIKSKKLKKVGKNAIKGIYKKATIKCPGKTYVKRYKKLFSKKTGYTKNMKLK